MTKNYDKDVPGEPREPGIEEWAPLSVRNARRLRKNLWPHVWISFATIIILATTLAILAYRMGERNCH